MAALGQLGNEAAADRAARADHQNSHDVSSSSIPSACCHTGPVCRVTVTDTRAGGNVTGVRENEATDAWLAERFEEHRGRLRAVAYRMLGSLDEADDAVQEAWVRFSAAGADEVVNLGGWLTTIVEPGLPEHAARPRRPAGDPGRVAGARPGAQPGGGPDTRAGGAARRLGRARAARGARHADPGRTGRVRAARRVRLPVRRDRPDARPHAGSRQAAGQPGAAPGQGGGRARAGRRRRRAAGGGQRVLRRRPGRRPGRAGRAARPRGRAAHRRLRGRPGGAARRRRPCPVPSSAAPARTRSSARCSSTGPPACSSPCAAGRPP